jgi:hypothetical protein
MSLLEAAQRAASVDLDCARIVMDRWAQYERGSLMRRWAAARIRAGGNAQDVARLERIEESEGAA